MTLAEVVTPGARFFLKSEYGPLSADWPVVAFTQQSFDTQLRQQYQAGRDFIVYLGTMDENTLEPSDRGRLLSIAEIDTTRVLDTYDHLSPASREWAEQKHPNRWLRCFRVVRGYDVDSRPTASELLTHTNRNMWHVPFRIISDEDLPGLLKLGIDPIQDVDVLKQEGRTLQPLDLLLPENRLAAQEAVRLANLVFNRVALSGQVVARRAPERTAPTDLQLQILEMLLGRPLLCDLCHSPMELGAKNKLLKISGDRRDSSKGDYGPENYQLTHLACNLAKNNGTDTDFLEWLELVRAEGPAHT